MTDGSHPAPTPERSPRLRRRALLGGAAGTLAVAATAGTVGYQQLHDDHGSGTSRAGGDKKKIDAPELHSRIDIVPPAIDVKVAAGPDVAPGYVFLAPKQIDIGSGPVILDNSGQVVWADIYHPGATDFRVQRYDGKPVLTFWHGLAGGGHGRGEYSMLDTAYRRVATIRAGNGLNGDEHECNLTDDGTALITAYHAVRTDLASVGGPRDGWVLEGVFQEIDVASGSVRFEWHSMEHTRLTDSYSKIEKSGSRAEPFDYFHINSVDKNADGDYLVSSRGCHTLYKVDGRTGAVRWRLGGRRNEFDIDHDAVFRWQHNGRWREHGRISLFDNQMSKHSRGLVLDVDQRKRTASMHRQYVSPEKLLGNYEGNTQFLPNGNVFVGWGSVPYFTEFAEDGTVLYHVKFNDGQGDSYRAFRDEWSGRPTDHPLVSAEYVDRGRIRVYASWNGATGISSWQLSAGDDADELSHNVRVDHAGFDTSGTLPAARHVRATALDADGQPMATSAAITPFGAP